MIFDGHDILTAIQFAEKEHRLQERRYTGEPYIVHLLSVSKMVTSAAFDKLLEEHRECMVVAAILHDIVEDTAVTSEEVHKRFGSRVGQYVDDLTDPPNSVGNRKKRKEMTRERLKTACDEVKIIKCADIIDNMHSIVTHDPDFAKVFLREIGLLIPLLETPKSSLHRELVELHAGFSDQTMAMAEGKPVR